MSESLEALRAEHETLLRFVYQAPVGLLLMRRDGAIELLNPETVRLLAPRSTQIQNVYALLGETGSELRAAVLAFEPSSGVIVDQQRWFIRSDSADTPGLHIAVTVHRLESDAYMVSLQELSRTLEYEHEIRRSSEALGESEQRFRLMADATPAMIWTAAPDSSGDYFNQTWLDFTGRSLEAELGDGWLGGVHPDDRERCFRTYLEAFATRRPFQQDYRLLHRDGSWRWVLDHGAPRITPDGMFAGFVGSSIDITDRINAQQAQAEALRAADEATQAKSRFLAMVSHEIRTPLTAILGLSQLAGAESEIGRIRDYAGMIHAAGTDLLTLINDLLDASKMDAGKLELDIVGFDLRALLARVQEMLGVMAGDRGLILRLELAPGLPSRVCGDPLRLRQVLVNLLSNAIKFTPAGTVELRVESSIDTDEVLFVVTDTGVGIPAEYMSSLFEPFTQAESSTTRRFGGTGLGLAISSQLVRMMGGELQVVSTPGVGSRFCFGVSLPRERGELSGDLQKPGAAGALDASVCDPGLRGRRVLLVDDMPINQLVARKFLERAGIIVTTAENGLEALDAATGAGAAFDAILMDLQMPEMDGFEAARNLCARLGDGCPPILAMTAHSPVEEAARCREAGMAGCLGKPIDVERLLLELARVMDIPTL